jgi:hypothetical protein
MTVQSFRNNFDSVKSTTGDKQDVLCVYLNKFWSGCLRPPLGGTLTTVPSNNFIKPVVPLPETSRVIDGLSLYGDFVYFINKTIPLSALANICLKQTCQDTLRLPNITGLC